MATLSRANNPHHTKRHCRQHADSGARNAARRKPLARSGLRQKNARPWPCRGDPDIHWKSCGRRTAATDGTPATRNSVSDAKGGITEAGAGDHLPAVTGLLAYSFLAGMAATVNPCGFVMLPGLVSFYLGVQ